MSNADTIRAAINFGMGWAESEGALDGRTERDTALAALDALVSENQRLRDALAVADDLLRRLAEWDMLYIAPDGTPITADAPYWLDEIARARAALDGTPTEVTT